MIELVKLLSIIWEIAQSQQLWFLVAIGWMLAFGWLLYRRMSRLERGHEECGKALAECRANEERTKHTLDRQLKMINAMNSMYMVLRGYMMATGRMDPRSDSLAMAQMENLLKEHNDG